MTKKNSHKRYDDNLIEALEKLPSHIYDKKHNIYIYVDNGRARSNESRYEHIAKSSHQLNVNDIKEIVDGIHEYIVFRKSKELKGTYYYFIKRKGKQKGLLKLTIQMKNPISREAYIKTIYVVYRVKW